MFDNFSKKTLEVLKLFLDSPRKEFYLREISKMLKISPSTVKIALAKLSNEKIIIKRDAANVSFYKIDTDNKSVLEIKKAQNLQSIAKEDLVGQITRQNSVVSITLFGSYAEGLNTDKSDIDILVIANKKISYEPINCHGEVNIIQYTPTEWRKKAAEDVPFYQEIITKGIVLKGILPVI
jgi:DNA-binding Lrp family transcriptional regulator